MKPAEVLEDLGQIVYGNAGNGTDPETAGLSVQQGGDRVPQRLFGIYNFLNIREQQTALGGQLGSFFTL